jgi:hypothetical protein
LAAEYSRHWKMPLGKVTQLRPSVDRNDPAAQDVQTSEVGCRSVHWAGTFDRGTQV